MNQPIPDKESLQSQKPLSGKQIFLRATLLSLLFAGVLLFITCIAVVVYGYSKFQTFLRAADLSQDQVIAFVREGWHTPVKSENGVTTLLLLGVDTVANKSEAPPLTDTMLLITLNHHTGKINTLSLPRDLWSNEYQTKINALYVYGNERFPDEPKQFPKEVLQQMTGIPIHYTVVVSLDMVADLVDQLGGVTISVPQSFTDPEFPRSDISIETATSGAELYETVTFSEGPETMDGERVLKYIRSRHSNGDTGTDTDRTVRQQLVLSSIAQSINISAMIKNPEQLAALYSWYKKYLQSTFSEKEIVAFGKVLYPHRESVLVTSHGLAEYPDDPEGLIEHPPITETKNQWSFVIRDPENFKLSVYDMLIN